MKDDGRPDFELLFEKARPQLLAVARRLMRNEAEAEDIVQQAFINGLAAADRFEGRAQVTSWMYRITYNTALMALRSKRRKPTESLDALTEAAGDKVLVEDEDESVSPAESLQQKGLREALGRAMSTLAPIDQKIVSMRLYDGYSTAETARALGLSTSATKTRLHRARASLRENLDFAALQVAH